MGAFVASNYGFAGIMGGLCTGCVAMIVSDLVFDCGKAAIFAVGCGCALGWLTLMALAWAVDTGVFSESGRAERAAEDRERVAKAMRREAAAQREIDALLAEIEGAAKKRGGERG